MVCGIQHVLMGLLGECRKQLEHSKIAGTVLLDLSKTFDCIPHDLLIVTLNGLFTVSTITLKSSCLESRKQSIRKRMCQG